MQRRDEDDLVPILQTVIQLSLELPIGIVDENQYPRSSAAQNHRPNQLVVA